MTTKSMQQEIADLKEQNASLSLLVSRYSKGMKDNLAECLKGQETIAQQAEQIAGLVATNATLDAEWKKTTADKFAEMEAAIRVKDAALKEQNKQLEDSIAAFFDSEISKGSALAQEMCMIGRKYRSQQDRIDKLEAALIHIQQVACSGSPELGIAKDALK